MTKQKQIRFARIIAVALVLTILSIGSNIPGVTEGQLFLGTAGALTLLTLLILKDMFAATLAERRAKANPGFCTHCQYDLRASKLRCPECGTLIPLKTSPKSSASIPN